MDIFIVNLTGCNLTFLHREHPAPERTLLNSNYSMPKLPSSRTLIILSLLLSGVYLALGSPTADAAQLLDVRIGEYDGFTRIVFEVDTVPESPQIEILPMRKLKVGFQLTDVNLVRKIPVERSRHIKAIQFWQSNDQLSAVLLVDYPHFRFKTFPLSNPPRIAVDIYPMAAPATIVAPPDTSERPVQSEPESPVEKAADQPATVHETAEPMESPPLQTDKTEAVKDQPSVAATDESPKLPKHRVRAADPKRESTVLPSHTNRQSTFRLQFFLVIGLVVITIGILFLLLMMLFARHRFSEFKTKLSTGDVLRQQDQKIEALNSRIEEQLKRYDKV